MWEEFTRGHVKFRRPKSWKAWMDGDVHMTAPPPQTPGDFRVYTRGFVGTVEQFHAEKEISADSGKRVKNAVVTSQHNVAQFGLAGIEMEGTGLSPGGKPRWWLGCALTNMGTVRGIVQMWVWTSKLDLPIINAVTTTLQPIT